MNNQKYKGNVLITGSSRGIGLASSLLLAREGYKVFGMMRDPKRSTELSTTAKKENLPVIVSVMDVNSDESVTKAIKSIRQEHGPIDVLVNNAGIERRGSIEELDLEEFKAVMETNYFGSIRCIKAVLPEMRSRKSGCIINVSSIAGRIASAPLTPYSASKFALEALSEGLASEVKTFGIRVAIVEPGIIDTDMSQSISNNFPISHYPQGRRFSNLFKASLRNPISSSVVADKILEIIENKTEKFRHLTGPDTGPFIEWRASMTDEEWIDWWSVAEDDTWYNNLERDLGVNARDNYISLDNSQQKVLE